MLFLSMFLHASAGTFVEDFGTLQSTGCDVQWDTACEQGWDGHGATASLAVCDDGTGNDRLVVDATGSTPNGISRTIPIGAGDTQFEITADGFTDGVGLRIKVEFLDAQGSILNTRQFDRSISNGFIMATAAGSIPNGSSDVRVLAGVTGGGFFDIDKLVITTFVPPWGYLTCDTPAQRTERRQERKCEERGENWYYVGECEGTGDPSYPGGCRVDCEMVECRYFDPDNLPHEPTC